MTTETSHPSPHRELCDLDPCEFELFERARDWLWRQGESGWVADAFAHWVLAEVPRPVPEPLSQLLGAWNHDAVPRTYRARHGARLSGSPRWRPGDPLPAALRTPNCAERPERSTTERGGA